jgi:hypothetical protein
LATLGIAGDTSIDTSVAFVTVKTVLPLTPLLVADTVVLPAEIVVARPFEPAALLTFATAPSDESQVTCVVRSCIESSVKRPVAVNCCVCPFATPGVAGDTSIDTSVASVTVNVVPPVTFPLVADTVVLPTDAVVTRPYEPTELLTVATAPADDAQVTCVVRSCVESSV